MAPSATISVDVQGLKDLAGRCRNASVALVSDTGLFSEGTNGIEHSGLTDAVNRFEERWSDKRHKIKDALEKTATAFVKVAESFDEADQQLARAIEPAGQVRRLDPVATPVAPGVDRIDYVETPVDRGGSTPVYRIDPVPTRVAPGVDRIDDVPTRIDGGTEP